MDKLKTTIREPSTWASLAAILYPILQAVKVDPDTGAAVVSIVGALGVLLRERGGKK